MPDEGRLEQLRQEAFEKGVVHGQGPPISGGPIPKQIGYYGLPLLKPPVWTWEISVYFFVGGLSGMASVIALAAALSHHGDISRLAILVAAIGAIVSPILLTMDLGRPRLFLNMLRVFKYRSPMSVGAWILTFFGVCTLPALIFSEMHTHQVLPAADSLFKIAAGISLLGSAFFGLFLATYTGVLIGATAIPAWFLHRRLLPIHFGVAGLGSAAAMLELASHRIFQLNALGFVTSALEIALWIWLEIDKHGAADRALHEKDSGWLIRGGELFSGPVALLFRLFAFVPLADIAFLLGSLLTRFGWVSAGRNCACDAEAVLASQY